MASMISSLALYAAEPSRRPVRLNQSNTAEPSRRLGRKRAAHSQAIHTG